MPGSQLASLDEFMQGIDASRPSYGSALYNAKKMGRSAHFLALL